MYKNEKAAVFLKDQTLMAQVLNLSQDDLSCLQLFHRLGNLVKNPQGHTSLDISYFRNLAMEYCKFNKEKFIGLIELTIHGIDGVLFNPGDVEQKEIRVLIEAAENRLRNYLSYQNAEIDVINDLKVIWFPPMLINMNDFLDQELETLFKEFLLNDLGLVGEVNFVMMDGTGDYERELFYEKYFLPSEFLKMLGLGMKANVPPSGKGSYLGKYSSDRPIIDYIRHGEHKLLEVIVRSQLDPSLDFKITENGLASSANISTDTQFIMPYFSVLLKQSDNSINEVLAIVSQKFDVFVRQYANGGQLVLECRAPEGPYAETISEIISNIEMLKPYILESFLELGLELESLQFQISPVGG